MRHARRAPVVVIAGLLLATSAIPVTVRAAGVSPSSSGTPSAPAASNSAFLNAGAGTDLVVDVAGYFVGDDSGARFAPIVPVRLLDTRTGNGLSGAFRSGTPRVVAIAGRGGIPAGAVAVTLNVTVTGSTSGGYVSLGPAPTETPTTSTINFPKGDTRANGATVTLDGAGRIAAVFKGSAGASTHVVIDVTGFYLADAGTRFTPVAPVRFLDSRTGAPFRTGVPKSVTIAGRAGIPAGIRAVTANVTMVDHTSNGYFTVGPTVSANPTTSTVNAPRGDIRANGTTVPLDAQGRLQAVFRGGASARADLVIDVTGYFLDGAGATYVPLEPVRVLDTRSKSGPTHMFATSIPRRLGVAKTNGIPAGVPAANVNITVTNQTSKGYVTVGPGIGATPRTSTLNFPLGETRANNATLGLDGDGALTAVFKGSSGPNYPSYDSRYHDEWELVSLIRDAELAYPDIVDVFVVGKSYEGRPIWGAKVSDNVGTDEAEPEVMFDALHHAREHLSIEQILDVFTTLTSGYATDGRVKGIVDGLETWFIFAVNPDGWAFDLTGSPYRGWRKNRQPNSGTTARGTDLNRNYDYRWGCCGGSSGAKAAWNYRGSAPFSAVETRVVRDFVKSRVVGGKQQIRAHISFHTNGEYVMWPYGYTYANIPSTMREADYKVFTALGRKMASLNGYKAMQSSDLYVHDGTMTDWMYGRYRILSFTIELYPTETIAKPNDHEPPDEVIARENARNRPAILYFLDYFAP